MTDATTIARVLLVCVLPAQLRSRADVPVHLSIPPFRGQADATSATSVWRWNKP